MLENNFTTIASAGWWLYEYNAYGFLSGIVDANNTSTRYYQVTAMDERGNVTQSQDGNGVTTVKTYDPATGRLTSIDSNTALQSNVQNLTYNWDELGNLNWRRDHSGNKQLQENFAYDSLNRLTSATVGTTTESVTYDTMGNITYKSDVGTYKYTSQCTTGYGTHAVCETTDGVVYSYDSNGNMTSDTAVGDVGGRTISYTTFDKPSSIQKGTHTTTFAYGPDRARYKRVDTAGSAVTTTWYLGSVEQVDKPNGTQEIKRYLPGNALVTLYLSTASPVDGSRTLTDEKTRYMYKDHLGSLDVITNDMGGYAVNDQYSFDAWGSRRDAIDWSAFTMTQLLQFGSDLDVPAHDLTERGFTWHEMLDAVGVIHMNGRIYDPKLGRFMQADPNVDGATNTQGFNRYSYVHNNPINATDPSGYLSFKNALGIVVGVVLAVATYGAATAVGGWATSTGVIAGQTVSYVSVGGAMAAGAAAGAVGAFSSSLISTGNLKAAVSNAAFGAMSGAVFGGIGAQFNGTGAEGGLGHIGSHAMAGGIMNVLQGGKFGRGFVSAGLTKFSSANWISSIGGDNWESIMGRTLVAATVGGTVSEISGGKFANGAKTAAFAHLFNQESSKLAQKRQQRDTGAWAQTKAFTKGIFGWVSGVGRTVVTGASTACEGISTACAANVENSRRIGRAIFDYQNDPKVQQQVDMANDLATELVMTDPIIQSQIAGRAAVTAIVTTTGPIGAGLNAMAITGGALRASEAGGNVADIVHGALGIE